jgi:hypothetical protein
MKNLATVALTVVALFGAACEKEQSTAPTAPPKAEAPAESPIAKTDPGVVSAVKGVCALSGAAGSIASCPIRIAALPDTAAARALQGTLVYDGQRVAFEGLYQTVTAPTGQSAETAITADAPSLARTGHTVVLRPETAESWDGKGSFIVAHFNSPTTPITGATLRDGAVEGDATMATARFRLLTDVAAGDAVQVQATGLVASDDAARALPVEQNSGVLVTGGVK